MTCLGKTLFLRALLIVLCQVLAPGCYLSSGMSWRESEDVDPGSVTQLSLGWDFTCALRQGGPLWCWGNNENGQLGDGTNVSRNRPVAAGTERLITRIAAGGAFGGHTCAVDAGEALLCWGENDHGQLGDGTNESTSSVTLVDDAADWLQMSAGGTHTCAVRQDGTLWCWGSNSSGQLGLGLGYEPDEVHVPTQAGTDGGWVMVTAAYGHTCAIKSEGSLWCWGEARGGELGVDIDYWVDSPLRVGSDEDWQTVSGSHLHTCALKVDGSLWCWGQNSSGQIGDGTVGKRPTPYHVEPGSEWGSASAGGATVTGGGCTCAVRVDGTLWCWGDNSEGRLGVAPIAASQVLAPAQVGTEADWSFVASGSTHVCAVKEGGSLWCWGGNSYGQIGDGTSERKTAPTSITW